MDKKIIESKSATFIYYPRMKELLKSCGYGDKKQQETQRGKLMVYQKKFYAAVKEAPDLIELDKDHVEEFSDGCEIVHSMKKNLPPVYLPVHYFETWSGMILPQLNPYKWMNQEEEKTAIRPKSSPDRLIGWFCMNGWAVQFRIEDWADFCEFIELSPDDLTQYWVSDENKNTLGFCEDEFMIFESDGHPIIIKSEKIRWYSGRFIVFKIVSL